MILGSMKEIFLTHARDIFLFDCQVGGLDAQVLNVYRNVFSSFIHFTGDIQVKELKPDHVRTYIANLSDGPSEGDEHDFLVLSHHDIIQTWIHWMYSQKFINDRAGSTVEAPRLRDLFPLQFTSGSSHPSQGRTWCV